MPKPPSATIPGMTDTLDFVKNLWGSMSLPGASLPGMSGLAGPPLSLEDLDKRIADLKAVESWLNLNLGMLHGSIQALEVQRGTLATLKSMGASMAEAMRQSGVSTETMAAMPFAPFFGATPAPGTAKPAAAAPGTASAPAQPAAPASGNGGSGGAAQPGAAPPPPAPAAGDNAGAAAMGMPAAMAWWSMLQDQFTQAVNAAIVPPAGTPEQASKEAPAGEAPKADGAAPAGRTGGSGKVRASRPKADKA